MVPVCLYQVGIFQARIVRYHLQICPAAQPLKVQMLQAGHLIEDAGELLERHEGRRTVRWPILAELDWTHLAAKVALTDRLDLEKTGQRREATVGCPHRKNTRNDSAPLSRQKMATIGMTADVSRSSAR